MSQVLRFFIDPISDTRYRVSLAPYERRHARGVSRELNALVVETETGGWVGSVPLCHTTTLESISEAHMAKLVTLAARRG
jgi:hypothetical protein